MSWSSWQRNRKNPPAYWFLSKWSLAAQHTSISKPGSIAQPFSLLDKRLREAEIWPLEGNGARPCPAHVWSSEKRVEFELLPFPHIKGGLHFLPIWSLIARIININPLIHIPSIFFNSSCNWLGILFATNTGVIINPRQNVPWKATNLNFCLVTIATPRRQHLKSTFKP